jgi:hypothetical protein
VNANLDQLGRDLDIVVQPLRATGGIQRVSSAVTFYNLNRRTLTLDQRRALLAEIADDLAAYEAAEAASPGEAVQGIRDAHAALVTYAQSRRTSADLDALTAAIAAFNRRLQPLAEAVGQMRGMG